MRCKHITTLLIVSLFVTGSLFTPTKRAHALVSCIPAIAPIPDIPLAVPVQNFGEMTRQNIANTFSASNFTKECILDAMVTFLKEALIQNITGSIVDWINNDFEGGPAFVTDPAGFFVNIADETAGRFIENQLGQIGQLLCSPFDLRLRLNLWLATSASRKQYIGCRLTDVQMNVHDAFTQGSFIASGGWKTFNAITSDPRNNQYGAFLYASDALNNEFVKRANETLRDLSYGRGFLSFKKCSEWVDASSEGTGEGSGKRCAKYKVETPGSLINNQLNNAFGSELRKFELADEINEVFQALVNYGLRQVFTATGGGLRGASKAAAGQESAASRLRRSEGTIMNEVYANTQTDTTGGFITTKYDLASKDDNTLTKVVAETKSGSAGGSNGERLSPDRNLALNRPASQSGYYALPRYDADKAVNGGKDAVKGDCYGFNCAAVTSKSSPIYWEVALGKTYSIKEVWIHKANDLSYDAALGTFKLSILKPDRGIAYTKEVAANSATAIPLVMPNINTAGAIVRIERANGDELALAEVEVYGTEWETATANTPPPTGVTAPPPSATPVVSVQRNVELKIDGPVFTINEPIVNAHIGISMDQQVGTTYKPFAPQQAFSKILVRVKNQETGVEKFTEEFTNTEIKTYRTTQTFSATAGEKITVGYEFTPQSGAKGNYALNTEIIGSDGNQVPGAVSTMRIQAPN